MKKWIVTITMTLAATLLPVPSFSAENNFDWKEFLGQYDMLWDNDITADPVFPEGIFGKRHWGRTDGYYSGALMGNGLLGTNLYKLTDGVYRLNVGRSDVTEAREPFNVYNSGRLPIGYFTFSTVGQVQDEKMRLSIYDAVTSGVLKTNAGNWISVHTSIQNVNVSSSTPMQKVARPAGNSISYRRKQSARGTSSIRQMRQRGMSMPKANPIPMLIFIKTEI